MPFSLYPTGGIQMADESQEAQAGWYDHAGGKRFYDGERWTDHYAYVGPTKAQRASGELFLIVLCATFLGVLLALGVVWLGAQSAPDDIYFPVKFVVESSELPPAFQ